MPVLEAMHFGVPVVAYAASAVPETVADAGVLLPDKDPMLVATAVDRGLRDAALRADVVAAGHRRTEAFSLERTRRQLLAALDGFVGASAGAGSG